MDEAKRLNMLEGHFFWLWVDASRDIDVFHNIGNKTRFVEDDDLESESLPEKDEARFKRSDLNERDDVDNNLLKEKNDSEKLQKPHKSSKINVNGGSYVKNRSINSFFRHSSSNKTEAHSSNNKLLYVNFSQSYDNSRDISTEAVRNYNVNNKGVETSKIENNSIEKEKLSFPDRNYSRHTSSYLGMENESFNKYVNSINVDGVNKAEKNLLLEEVINSSNVKDSILFSSDTSDFLMNPTVHTSTMHNVRDTIEKRKDRTMMEPIMERNSDELRNNVTVIFNSLPVGLLALHPQPMIIGK